MSTYPLWNQYPELKEALIETTNLIEKTLFVRNKAVNQAMKEIFKAHGKMIRPAYCLLFSSLGNQSEPARARHLAASIELFHNATLLHDDIIDDGKIRRGLPTVQSVYGKKAAVYAGDYLISACFKMTLPYSQQLDTQGLLTRAMEQVIKGELQQLSNSYNPNVSFRQYLTQIKGKTAELFAISCLSGAQEGGLNKQNQQLSFRIGLQIGMAFQLLDDLLEYTQSEEEWGKSLLQDLSNGIYTAPVILSKEKAADFFADMLKQEEWSKDEADSVRQILVEAGGIDKTRQLAERYTRKALKLISQLPSGEPRNQIEQLTRALLQRKS
ncbi:polyprenyl synthetase family protein [Alkalibacterium sp. AK22]|uniref:polyprenyl synthetase family protein n=1 Tax=Alkalibacterium sp. AK22 TaxID=1229520 RepID=UPI000555B0D9|nr:polyprenyl synthetase family protein [Alkalibacterium sp. AK22]